MKDSMEKIIEIKDYEAKVRCTQLTCAETL